MKILLAAVNAKYIHSCLAVYSLQNYARAKGQEVEIKEYTINQQMDVILKDIYERKPNFLAFSCYIWNISMILRISRELKKIMPDLQIWLGGPEVTYESDRMLKEHPWIDGIMRGEGEETFLELVKHFRCGKPDLEEIAGLTMRNSLDDVCLNKDRAPMDMSDIPFPYHNMKEFEHRLIYYESSRGCPFSCSYCLSSIDKKLRFRSLDLVLPELQFFLDQKLPQVKFVDRTFNSNKNHARTIWNYIIDHDNGVTNFHFEIAADLLDEEDMAIFRRMRPGLIQLEIGVQTTNEEALKEIRRPMKFSHIAQVVNEIQSFQNIHQHLDLIAGLPYEGFDSFRKSFNDVYHLHPQQLQLGFLKVLKGSLIWEKQDSYHLICQSEGPYEVLYTEWIDYQDVLQMKLVEEMVEVYYNSTQFSEILRWVEEKETSLFDFFLELGSWYDRKFPEGISHSRMARYINLREFLQERYPDESKLIDEILAFDYYLRENAKSRPSWKIEQEGGVARQIKLYDPLYDTVLSDYSEYDHKQIRRMTHMEFFDFDLVEDRSKKACAILFDYKKRDPLTGNASCIKIELEEEIDGE